MKSEAAIQAEIVKWYRNTYCLKHHNPRCMIFSIPNESNGSRAMKLIQTGLYSGCADLCVIHNDGGDNDLPFDLNVNTLLFFEVKKPKGVQSLKQKEFEAHCKLIGIGYYIVRSLEDFKHVINSKL